MEGGDNGGGPPGEGAGFPGSGLFSAAVRHVSDMFQNFLSSSLNWEDFLDALNDPDQLGQFVQEHERAVGLHLRAGADGRRSARQATLRQSVYLIVN